MELQFNKTALPCLRQATWETQTQEQTQEVKLSDAMPDIGKVLGAWGQALVRGKQWNSGGMNISGGVMAWVLYAPEDGSEARCVETWLPFQMSWDFPDTQRDGTINAACQIKSVDARSISARKLMVRSCVSVLGEALEPIEVEVYTPGELPEDIRLLKERYPVKLPREAGEKSFLLDEELTLPSSAPAMEKLMRFSLQPELIDQKVMAEKVVFRGAANLHILYQAENGVLKTWDFEVPFSQYTDLTQTYDQDASAQVILAVTSLEMEPGEEGRLRLKAGLVGQYVIFDRPVVEIVEDAYSPNRKVEIQTQQLELPAVLEEQREILRAEQTVPMEDGQVVDVTFYAEQPRIRRKEEQTELEVPGMFQLLCQEESGSLQGATARWDGSWTTPAGDGGRVEARSCLTGRPQASVSGQSAEVRGEVVLELCTVGEKGLPMVTALELGELEEPDPGRPSLILRRIGDDRLWDVAKQYGSSVEAICQANHLPEGSDPDPECLLLIPVS